MGTAALVFLLFIIGTVIWMKKMNWQSSNPIAYVGLIGSVFLIGVLLIPLLPEWLVPDFLEKWAYVDAYKDKPGGAHHMLFFFLIMVSLIGFSIISRIFMRFIRGQKSQGSYLVVFTVVLILISGTLGMNLRAMGVDLPSILGKGTAPIAQQAVVSGMNTIGNTLNGVRNGLQSQELHAPQHIIQEAESAPKEEAADDDLPTWKPWEVASLSSNREKGHRSSETYTPLQNDVDVAQGRSLYEPGGSDEDSYDPSDFAPAVEPNDNSAYDYWQEERQAQKPDKTEKKKEEKKNRPLRFKGPDGN